jgi:hypothetical protein
MAGQGYNKEPGWWVVSMEWWSKSKQILKLWDKEQVALGTLCIRNLTVIASTLRFLMKELSNLLSTNNLKSVYYAYFHSLVKYAIIYWGNTPECQKIFLIQKKVIRIMMGAGPTHSCRNLFKILPIPCVHLLSLMTFVVNNYDKFSTNKSMHTFGTRSNDHLHIPASRLLSYQIGIYYSGAQLFNILPTSITALKMTKGVLGWF